MKSLYVFPRRLVASEVRINHHEGIGLGKVSASVGELKLYSASRRGYVVVTASPDWSSGSVLDVVSRCLPLGGRAMPVLLLQRGAQPALLVALLAGPLW